MNLNINLLKLKMIQVKVKGIKQVHKLMIKLPKQIDLQIGNQGESFMKAIRKSAKLRAPRWTGALARSIKYAKKGRNQWNVIVKSPYGYFQEFGFRPHYVQLFRSTRAGGVVADWAAEQGIKDWKGSIFVSKYKPFITPALEMNLAKLPMMLKQGTKQAIKNARR